MEELVSLRKGIDEIDRQLLPLFLKRMELCGQVADCKRQTGMAVLDAEREKQVLESKMALLDNPEMQGEVCEFFNSIMTISRVRQSKLLAKERGESPCRQLIAKSKPRTDKPAVAYFGSEGAYSEEGAIEFFGKDCDRFYSDRFEGVFTALKEGKADYGVLPIENSSTGTIAEVVDLLTEYGYYIIGEVKVPIRHCLLGTKESSLGDIKTVYSHEQGLLQCGEFLNSLGDITHMPYYSTALGARLVGERGDKSLGAIASGRTAELYGLKILAENINTNACNTTRFAVIAPRPEITEACDKISVRFILKHESGALARVLATFAQGGLNLLKLESRPISDRPFEYSFYADYTGCLLKESVKDMTDNVIAEVQEFEILGNYKSF